MREEKTVHVIGGGLGGLSAAITLATAGMQVILHEQQPTVGGKANTRMIGDFRFDTGPSLLTLPSVFARLFERAGKRIDSYIPIVGLSPITRYWFSDGTHFASDTWDRFIPTLMEKLSVTERQLNDYHAYAKRIWDLTHEVFLEHSLHAFATYASKKTLGSLLRIGSIDALRTMHTANAKSFTDPRMVQLLDRYATYNGSDPYQAPATLNNIAYVEHGLGGHGVRNGIYGIVLGMERLARELGVDIHTGERVDRIGTDRNRTIESLTIGGKTIPARMVVSDVDVLTLHDQLLGDPDAPLVRRYRRLPPSSSALVFYWGIDRECSALGLHNIFFSSDYAREFNRIHRQHQIAEDPTIYINITSKLTSEDAPRGQENWFVLVNAPPDDGRDWTDDLQQTRQRVLLRLSEVLRFDVARHIVAEDSLTPARIAHETGSFRGSLYGISSNTSMAAFLRHPNVSRRYRGLYLCGGSVHPGGGMPLAVLSGVIAGESLLRRFRRWES
ncbi:MAG: phytoene desaturase family protein [Sphaerochaetaceae bacterium]|jgi:phytoene desaturase|nr:phytoene desaturase family protein [Sphaerochaetaceae bacterium]MDX9939597.1 phytoene desaturase family protein [Sphaerochaetaceae bacterium]